jgi:predicted transcriptional regulator
MAILKAPPKPPKNETLQIRIEEQIRSKLVKYAEFIDSSESYVVSEALKLVFRKDVDFKNWLDDRNQNGEETHNGGGSLFEIAKKA